MSDQEINRTLHDLMRKGTPSASGTGEAEIVYALFMPEVASKQMRESSHCLVDAEEVLSSLK